MNDKRLNIEKQRYLAFKQKLLADDPAIDETTLADTLEGLSDFTDMLAATIRAALEDETHAAVLKLMMGEMHDRLERFEARAQRRREIVRDEMLSADITKLTTPDFTASLRTNSPHLVVVEEKLIPQTFFEMRPHLRKRDLLEALKDGVQIDGAVLSNPGMSLTVRTR